VTLRFEPLRQVPNHAFETHSASVWRPLPPKREGHSTIWVSPLPPGGAQKVGLEELGTRARPGLDAAVDRLEARESVHEVGQGPVEGRQVGLVEDERVPVEGNGRRALLGRLEGREHTVHERAVVGAARAAASPLDEHALDREHPPHVLSEEAQEREALGRSQGGFSTKLHLRAEGNGRPITVLLTGGERNEQIALEAVLDQGAVRRPGRGRPRLRPRAAAGDKGYSSPTARARLRRRHIRPVIPTRKDQPRQRNFDRAAYRLRNKVARLINRLKQARRIATRYEKRGDNYLAMVHIGMILLWMKPFADTA